MACSKRNCSGCGSCRRNHCAQVNYPDVSTCSGCNTCSNCNSCSSCNGCGYPPFRPPLGAGWNAANSGYGLLRTVPEYSALRRDWQRCWQDYPFYNGPCGPSASCCCDGGFPPPPPPLPPYPPSVPDNACPANATFIAGSPLNLAAGDNVTLSAINTTTDGFIPTTSGIRILNAGTYMVFYTVQIPAGETVNSRFVLTLDGGNIASSAVDVTTVATDDSSGSYTMHALIQAGDNSLLNLTALSALALTSTAAANVVTLTIVQVC